MRSMPNQGMNSLEVSDFPPSTFMMCPVILIALLRMREGELLLGGEKDYCSGHFLYQCDSLQRNAGGGPLLEGVVLTLRDTCVPIQVGVYCGGTDCIDPDPQGSQLQGAALGKHLQPSFGHAVADGAGVGSASVCAGNVDDAPLRLRQVRLEDQRQVEGASEVDIYQVVVILREGGLDVSVEDEA